MAEARKPTIVGRQLFRALVRLSRIYWTSPDAKRGLLLLALTVALELGTVYGEPRARGRRSAASSTRSQHTQPRRSSQPSGSSSPSMLGFVLVSAYRIYVRQALEIRWRRGSPAHYLERWISAHAYCQTRAAPRRGRQSRPAHRRGRARLRGERARALALAALGRRDARSRSAACSGALSGDWPLPLGGAELHIPGLMLWVAIGYAALSTLDHAPASAGGSCRSTSTGCASRPTSATGWCASATTSRRSRSRAASPSSGSARSRASARVIDELVAADPRAAEPDALRRPGSARPTASCRCSSRRPAYFAGVI